MISKRLLSLLIIASAAIGLALLAYGGSDFIVSMGHFIPTDDVFGDYLWGVIWAGLLTVSILVWPVPARDRPLLLVGWLARVIMTLGAMLFYEDHYDTDSFGYFYSACAQGFQSSLFSVKEGTRTMVALLGLHQAILPASYHMMKVSCSMAGFVAIYIFYRGVASYLRRDEPKIFYLLALYPSILFWSSIIGKETVILIGVAAYAFAVVRWYQTANPLYLLLLAAGLAETMFIRPWMTMILLAPLPIFGFFRMRSPLAKALLIALVAAAAFKGSGNIGGERFQDDLNSGGAMATFKRFSNVPAIGGSGRQFDTELTDVGSVAAFTPVGMFTALFRPLPGEVNNAFGLIAGLENLALLLLFLRAARRGRLRDLRDPLVVWAGLLVLIWSAAYGVISYQNLGTAVRFKVQILPILLLLLLRLNNSQTAPAPALARAAAV